MSEAPSVLIPYSGLEVPDFQAPPPVSQALSVHAYSFYCY